MKLEELSEKNNSIKWNILGLQKGMTVVNSAREICNCKIERKNPKNEWWNDELKLQYREKWLYRRMCWDQSMRS